MSSSWLLLSSDAARAETMFGDVVLALDQQMFEPAIPCDHAPDLAGRVVKEDLDPAHARQPAPFSRLTVSNSGRPITAG